MEDHWSEHLSHVFAASVETVTDKCGRRKLKKSKTVRVLFFIDMHLHDKCKPGGFIN